MTAEEETARDDVGMVEGKETLSGELDDGIFNSDIQVLAKIWDSSKRSCMA